MQYIFSCDIIWHLAALRKNYKNSMWNDSRRQRSRKEICSLSYVLAINAICRLFGIRSFWFFKPQKKGTGCFIKMCIVSNYKRCNLRENIAYYWKKQFHGIFVESWNLITQCGKISKNEITLRNFREINFISKLFSENVYLTEKMLIFLYKSCSRFTVIFHTVLMVWNAISRKIVFTEFLHFWILSW